MNSKKPTIVIAVALACMLCACSKTASGGVNSGLSESDVIGSSEGSFTKPSSITIMVDGTLITQENGRDEFEKQWEALTGIDLIIIQPEHDIYYQEVEKAFESGDLPDAVLLSSTYYTSYAAQNYLADISSYYQGSDLQASIQSAGKESLIDGIRINGKLY